VIPLTALYYGGFMDIDIADPTRRGQDLFTLSKGHAVAAAAAIYADLGYFSLPDFTGDPGLPEVLVKMVDASATSFKSFWFFYSGLTSLPYTVTVRDTVTGLVRAYASDGYCGGADTSGFKADPAPGLASIETESSRVLSASGTELSLLSNRFRVTLFGVRSKPNEIGEQDRDQTTLGERCGSLGPALGYRTRGDPSRGRCTALRAEPGIRSKLGAAGGAPGHERVTALLAEPSILAIRRPATRAAYRDRRRRPRFSDGAARVAVEDLDVGHPAGVVDRDMAELPAGSVGARDPGDASGDSVARLVEAAQLLDVDVDELTGVAAAVPVRRLGWLQATQPVETQAGQHRAHR
jgi:hypothetical protein